MDGCLQVLSLTECGQGGPGQEATLQGARWVNDDDNDGNDDNNFNDHDQVPPRRDPFGSAPFSVQAEKHC